MPTTTSLTAGEVMDRSAALMNDPAKTDFTHSAQLPYLNMAIDELLENLEESNAASTNLTAAPILLPVGKNKLTPTEDTEVPHYPSDLIEIQEVAERTAGSSNSFAMMTRKESVEAFPANSSLMYWAWEDQRIKFNPSGATSPREIQLKYVRQAVQMAADANSVIGSIGVRSFLAYKTAALCSMFIGENQSRAEILDSEAQKAMERLLGIGNKGRQQIFTRRRPFRAGYKSRGWV